MRKTRKKYNPKGRLKGGDVKQNRIMSRTRNLIAIARGTIAENARRQMSLLNQCRMPNPKNHSIKREQSKFYLLCRA